MMASLYVLAKVKLKMGNRIYLGLVALLPFFFWSLGNSSMIDAISGDKVLKNRLKEPEIKINQSRLGRSLQQITQFSMPARDDQIRDCYRSGNCQD
ncbi:MAG: hypothetical protein ACFB02_09955 [Mastigocoleus sp.]